METKSTTEFERAAAEGSGGSLALEFWHFLRHNKKWWLVPLVAIIVLQALLLLLSGSAAAPFIYPLF
jgi:hypothetical protein